MSTMWAAVAALSLAYLLDVGEAQAPCSSPVIDPVTGACGGAASNYQSCRTSIVVDGHVR